MFTRRLLSMLFLCLVFTCSLHAQGTRIDDSFYSVALEGTQQVDVYLPGGYDPADEEARYPVVYFLHGGNSTNNGYTEILDVLDEIVNNTILPVILVKPNGYANTWLGLGWWANSEYLGMYEDFFIQDLISYIDSTYNTYSDRTHRCIMGHSAGGYGAMMLATKYPEMFRGVATHTGVVHLGVYTSNIIAWTIVENGGHGPYDPGCGIRTQILFSMGQAFTPNLENPPHYETLCIDNDGVVIDSVYAEWHLMDPAYLITQYPDTLELAIFMDCGSMEPDFYSLSNAMADTLEYLERPYTYELYTGGHMEVLPERYPLSLAFLDSAMVGGVPYAIDVTVTPGFAVPVDGEVVIQAAILNEPGHEINVLAEVEYNDGTDSVFVQLFDDGEHDDGNADDGTWGNRWSIGDHECHFWIDLTVQDLETNQEHTRFNVASFTSIGPVTVDSVDILAMSPPLNPGELGFCQLTLRNDGANETAENLSVTLSTEDPLARVQTNASMPCDDLPPGVSRMHENQFCIEIDDSCIPDIDIIFTATVSSNGYPYWYNDFLVHVYGESDVDPANHLAPETFSLLDAYPNPCNPSAQIRVDIAEPSMARVAVYNLLGEEVAVLANGYFLPGCHQFVFDGRDFASGIYFVRVFVPGYLNAVQRVVLIK